MEIHVELKGRKKQDILALASEDDWFVEDGLLHVHAIDGTSVYNLDFVRVFDVVR